MYIIGGVYNLDGTVVSDGSNVIDGEVEFFTSLPDATTISGQIYVVTTTTGIIGFTRKQAGMYRSDGLVWKRLDLNYSASKTYYDKSNSTLSYTNLKDVIDELDNKVNNKINDTDFIKMFKMTKWEHMMSGGGNITWSGDNLSTSQRFILIPTNNSGGFININLTNLNVPNWNIAYIDLTDAQLGQSNLSLTQDDFTVQPYSLYTQTDSSNRLVLGYKNGNTQEFIFSNGQTIVNGITKYKDTGFIYPSFKNGWVNYYSSYGYTRYRRNNNIIIIEGLVRSGNIGKVVFTLPAGFRPRARCLFATETNSNTNGRLDVNTNGEVIAVSGSNSWYSVACSFSCI